LTSEIFKKWLIGWDVELQRKSRKILLVLDICRFFEKYPTAISVSQHHILVQPMDVGFINNLKTLYYTKLVNYLLGTIQENLQTSFSTAKEVRARIDLLQAVRFIADIWPRVSTKTIQNCFAYCSFKLLDLEMLNKANSENYVILEMHYFGNYEEFSCMGNGLQC
jgi:hypothetical protein